jgi:hypothetical protein
MDVEGSGRGLIYGTNPVLASRTEESHETPHARAAIRTGNPRIQVLPLWPSISVVKFRTVAGTGTETINSGQV